jgi:hypothetical protein
MFTSDAQLRMLLEGKASQMPQRKCFCRFRFTAPPVNFSRIGLKFLRHPNCVRSVGTIPLSPLPAEKFLISTDVGNGHYFAVDPQLEDGQTETKIANHYVGALSVPGFPADHLDA